jgi:hypothetical protein
LHHFIPFKIDSKTLDEKALLQIIFALDHSRQQHHRLLSQHDQL